MKIRQRFWSLLLHSEIKKIVPSHRCLRAPAYILAALLLPFLFSAVSTILAGSATWDLNATSGDWNTAANWTPMTVPNGQADIATFGLSNTTNVSISASTEVNEIVFTAAATNPYFIDIRGDDGLTLTGTGITNNSGITQALEVDSGLRFLNSSTAGSASIDNFRALGFSNTSTAGSAFIFNQSGLGFYDSSTAGSAHILNDDQFVASMSFNDSSTAGSALIETIGYVAFNASSQGGTARIVLSDPPGNSTGILDISGHNPPGVTIGSIESGTINNHFPWVSLGVNNLTTGSNNLSTTFSGFIEGSGSLTKIGNGTLVLSGENTYSGGTTIQGGKLLINNTTGSGTGSGPVQVNAGQLGGSGVISGDVTIGDASHRRGTLSPGDSGHSCDTLTIQSALTFQSDGNYKFNLDTRTATSDSVVANGVTINSGARFGFGGIGHRRLPIGTVFTVIENISPNPVTGTFSNLPDQSTFTKGNTYQASYQGGDGNNLTLTVVQ
jgi:autotransporter-associated beta strand protein